MAVGRNDEKVAGVLGAGRERAQTLPLRRMPDVKIAEVVGGNKAVVAHEGDGPERAGVAGHGVQQLAAGRFPELDRSGPRRLWPACGCPG